MKSESRAWGGFSSAGGPVARPTQETAPVAYGDLADLAIPTDISALEQAVITLAFLDVEASSLRNGYPIEVGWAIVCEDRSITTEGHLVRPEPAWLADEARWSWESELVHRISQVDLKHGLRCADIAARMNDVLGPLGTAYSDARRIDESWIDQIFAAAGVPRRFALHDVSRALEGADTDEVAYDRLERSFRSRPRPHRAAADARQWAELWVATRRQKVRP